MQSDFSAMGRMARELIPVPALPMESIRGRSHATRARGRMRTFAACAAVAVGAVGAGTGAGAKIYDDVRVWISGGKVAVKTHSGIIMRQPTASDLRNAIAHATFPVVFPVGLPADTRVTMINVAPADRPSTITIAYQIHGVNLSRSFALVDPAVVDADGSAPASSAGHAIGTSEHWRVGGETVLLGDKTLSVDEVNQVKAAMSTTSPRDSLTAIESMLPKVTVLGAGPVRLEIAEQHRPPNGRSVLLDQLNVRSVSRLATRNQPILDTRIVALSNVVYAHGDISKADVAKTNTIGVSAPGVRAIDAVLRSTGAAGNRDCGCEILFNQPNPSTYWVWTIPLSGSGGVRKYAVDATTFTVKTLP